MKAHTSLRCFSPLLLIAGIAACSSGTATNNSSAPAYKPGGGGAGGGSSGSGGSAAGNVSNGGKGGSSTGGAGGGAAGSQNPGGSGPGGGGAGGAGAGGSGGGGQPSDGGAGSVDGGSVMTPPTPHGTSTCLKPGSGNYSEPGPYQVAKMDVDLGMNICPNQTTGNATIFYPNPLETACPHPIEAWGNGTGVNGDSLDAYSFFHQNAASWGIVVIAAHDPNSGCGNYHKAGIDYLLKQNQDSTSPFYGKLSTRAGVAGHSQGALGATQGATHPNVEAEVSVAGGGVPPANVALICLTGTMDQLESSCTMGFQGAAGPAFLADWDGGDHTTTETLAGYVQKNPGTLQMERLLPAWLRCFLADDPVACKLFDGAPTSCGICQDMGWAKIQSRNF